MILTEQVLKGVLAPQIVLHWYLSAMPDTPIDVQQVLAACMVGGVKHNEEVYTWFQDNCFLPGGSCWHLADGQG